MPKANRITSFVDLRPNEGTRYANDWRGEASRCSHCDSDATHVVDKPIASRYSSEPNRMRTYRLCYRHACDVYARLQAEAQ